MKKTNKDYILVGIQLVLFLAFTILNDAILGFSIYIQNIGFVVMIVGIILILIAFFQLNRNLTVYPTPTENAILKQNGLYRIVRHPIYFGVITTLIGDSIYQNSIYKLTITGILVWLFHIKTRYEELQLTLKFPNYKDYKNKVGKFFPKLL